MTFLNISVLVIIVLSIFTVAKAAYGPTIWDRLLCLSILSAKIMTAICLIAAIYNRNYYLDVAMVFAILGFIGNVYLSRYAERRPRDD